MHLSGHWNCLFICQKHMQNSQTYIQSTLKAKMKVTFLKLNMKEPTWKRLCLTWTNFGCFFYFVEKNKNKSVSVQKDIYFFPPLHGFWFGHQTKPIEYLLSSNCQSWAWATSDSGVFSYFWGTSIWSKHFGDWLKQNNKKTLVDSQGLHILKQVTGKYFSGQRAGEPVKSAW